MKRMLMVTTCMIALILLYSLQTTFSQVNVFFDPEPIRSFPTNGSSISVTTGDFDGDGKIDVATANPLNSTVSILRNKSVGGSIFLAEPYIIDVGWEPWSIISGDFDLDGKIDLATANQGTEDITILRNVTAGGNIAFNAIQSCRTGRLPRSLLSFDFDGDGKLDLAVENQWSDSIFVYQNISTLGNIVFKLVVKLLVPYLSCDNIAVADFDNDGKVDLATSGSSTGIWIFRNTSTTGFLTFASPLKFLVYGILNLIAAADYDGDAKIDIALITYGNDFSILRNNSTTGNLNFTHEWSRNFSIGKNPSSVIACDLDGNGKSDIVVTSPLVYFAEAGTHDMISIALNLSTGGINNFKPCENYGVKQDPFSIASSDLDGDGKTDLVVGSDDGGGVSVLRNCSSGSDIRLNSAVMLSLDRRPKSISSEDFDGDGKLDLVTVNQKWTNGGTEGDGSMAVFQNKGVPGLVAFNLPIIFAAGKNPSGIATADYDGDGKVDIAVSTDFEVAGTDTSGSVYVFRNTSSGGAISFTVADSFSIGADQLSISKADFDGDGKIDIVVGCRRVISPTSNSYIAILRNTSILGKISFSAAMTIANIGRPKSVAVADFDKDGKVDLVVADHFTARAIILRNVSTTGVITFTGGKTFDNLYGIQSVICSDVDGDGKDDIILARAGGGDKGGVDILLNASIIGNINFASPIEFTSIEQELAVATRDMTGDGKPDIIFNNQACEVAVLENKCTPGSVIFSPAFPGGIILGDMPRICVVDFDGDGHPDIAAARDDRNDVYIIRTSSSEFVKSPTVPILLSPSNNVIGVPINTIFQWNNSVGATSYQLQVSTRSDFSTIVVDQSGITGTSYSISGLLNNTTYYWRVNASNTGGTSNWSSVWNFTTVVPAPIQPVLTSPSNNATSVSTSPTLTWNASSSATSYQLQVSTISTFATTVVDQSMITGTTYNISGLSNNTTYYWRVNATNSGGTSNWSSVWSFTTIIPIPTAPLLASPLDAATGVSKSPTLSWNASSSAISYQLQVSISSMFQTTIVDKSNITSTSYGLNNLINNTTYYWRVNATNAAGTSGWSNVWSFTTAQQSLIAPMLVLPADGATKISSDTTCTWNAISGATSYTLQVSTDAAFTTTFLNQSVITTTSQQVTGLANSTTYYWHVNASDGTATSPWSSTWSFTTNIAAPLAPTLISPANNSLNISKDTTLVWIASTGATSYNLQVSTDMNFTSTVINQNGITSTSFRTSGLADNMKYYWRVNAMNDGGASLWSGVWSFTTSSATGIGDQRLVPIDMMLLQNSPNPFTNNTRISYQISRATQVTIEVYNLFGQLIKTLVNENQQNGTYSVEWNGNDEHGDPVNTGMYFCWLRAGDIVQVRKMILIR